MFLRAYLSGFAASVVVAGSILGVSPDKQELYKPNADGSWHCLLDPSIVLLFDQINDDFCDCPDGSDEPGTNACEYTSEHPQLFYCANQGFKPNYIENYKLNDGVCDYELCCDGSDEYRSGQCPNVCAKVKEQYDEHISERREKSERGLSVKLEFEQKAAELKRIAEEQLAQLAKEIELLHEKNDGGKTASTSEVQDEKFIVVDEAKLNRKLEAFKAENSLLTKKLASLESAFREMTEKYNPNFNDAAVKNAIHTYQDYISNKAEEIEVDLEYKDIVVQTIEGSENALQGNDQSKILPTLQNMIHYYYNKLVETFPHNNEISTPPSKLSKQQTFNAEENEALIQKIKSKQIELDAAERRFKQDYGENDILRAIEGGGYEKKIGDYNYRIAFMNAVYQDNTLVGRYTGFNGKSMHFTGGDRCWNGPQRSATVEFVCAPEHDLLSVFEPQKCQYKFVLASPLVCEKFSESELAENFSVDKTKF